MIDMRQYEAWARTSTHGKRVARAREIVRRAYDGRGRVMVSVSYGKDSCALADLVRETVGGPVDIFHMAHSYPLPGYEEIREWSCTLGTVHTLELKALPDVIAWLREVGLGYERESKTGGARAKGDRASEWGRAHGFSVQLLGLRAEESARRTRLLRGKGSIYTRRTDGWIIGHPLAWWTQDDVWARIATRGIPYHRLYDCETHGMTHRTLRNSGWLTTIDAGEGRIAWLRRHFPEQYQALAREFPQVRILS